jgi:hypothetical protein
MLFDVTFPDGTVLADVTSDGLHELARDFFRHLEGPTSVGQGSIAMSRSDEDYRLVLIGASWLRIPQTGVAPVLFLLEQDEMDMVSLALAEAVDITNRRARNLDPASEANDYAADKARVLGEILTIIDAAARAFAPRPGGESAA